MAITFVKDTNGKVIVDDGVKVFSLDPSMNVIAHSADPELIVITDTSAPLETREAFKFDWKQVTTPANTSRNDLIEKLGKNFFYSSVAVSIPTDLAKEAKQDEQIALAEELNTIANDIATEKTLTELIQKISSFDSNNRIEVLLTTLIKEQIKTNKLLTIILT
jgi:hypothetical protein